jgi:hypothetical protein
MKIVRVVCNTLTAFLRVNDNAFTLKIPLFQFAECVAIEKVEVESGFLVVSGLVQLKGDPELLLNDSSSCDTKRSGPPIS